MKIHVVQSVLKTNDALAEQNRLRLTQAGVLALNITSAPGSGKTTLLERTAAALGAKERAAVLVGDLQTSRDAERIDAAGLQATQINTGRGCHLDAAQVAQGLDTLDLEGLAFLFIENVGNMVCPSGFDLGEHRRVAMLSTPEGDDKVAKYPTMFQPAHIVLLNKIDLSEVLGFEVDRVTGDLAHINSHAPFIRVSTKTGQGLEAWMEWLRDQRQALASSD